MIKKLGLTMIIILLFLVGGIIFWKQKSPSVQKRNYIVASVRGEVNYLSPLPFAFGKTVWQIIIYFDLKQSANLTKVYVKSNKQWKIIALNIKIFQDSVFKVAS